jgi:hypothetical protein
MFADSSFAAVPFASPGQANIAISVTGVSAEGQVGTVKTGIAVQPTGVEGIVNLNSVIAQANADAPVTGVEAANNEIGTVTVYLQQIVNATGVQAANDVGTVEVDAKANTIVTGFELETTLGSVTVQADADVVETGFGLAASLGTVEVDSKGTVFPIGVSAAGALGNVTFSTDNVISVTGFGLTASLGADEVVQADANVYVTQAYLLGEIGNVTVGGKATVYVTGVSARGGVSTPLVWGIIDTTQNPNWVPIAA